MTLDTVVRFAILGPLEVRRNGQLIEIGGQRLRALLTLLLLDAGRVVPVDVLVAGVWEDRPPAAVGNALQALVSRLRATIDRGLVVADASGYRLAVSPDQVDVHLFTRLAREGRRALDGGDAAGAARVLSEALDLWRGAPLTDLPCNGAEVARLAELRIATTEDRIDADLLLGRYESVAAEILPLIAAHPLRERLRGQLMRALYGSGRHVEALAAFEEARALFAEQLGVDPSPALAELHLAILRRDPVRPAPENRSVRPAPEDDPVRLAAGNHPVVPAGGGDPVWRAPEDRTRISAAQAVRKGNLRARLTSFVGREKDVTRAGELLAEHRLVTLLGPGGAGKTRLAVESAETLADGMEQGAWLVELAPLLDPAEIAQTVLNALGLRDAGLVPARRGKTPPLEIDATTRLAAALSGRRLLIVLDNCEHLIEAAAVLADRLLADCPGVRVLATSREPLGITGEMLWPVRPLDLDHAVRLFADRATAARPGYQVDGERPVVERICRELDGMPLAIELAAARLRTLSVEQIADRLNDRFRLLTGGSRTALPRHQTLRAVVDWSWELLDDDERRLAARLSVFAGGATLEGAEHVSDSVPGPRDPMPSEPVAPDPSAHAPRLHDPDSRDPGTLGLVTGPTTGPTAGSTTGPTAGSTAGHGAGDNGAAGDGEPWTLDVLGRLVDKSLVVFDDGRYLMLETIRVYAAERLAESGESQCVRLAHARFFTELAETADPRLRGKDQVEWLARLAAEHDNLSAALRWAIDAGEVDVALRLVGGLGWYWWLVGHRVEGSAKAAEVIRMTSDDTDPAKRAVALAIYGLAALGGDVDWDAAKAALQEATLLAGITTGNRAVAGAGPVAGAGGPGRLHPMVALAGPVLNLFLRQEEIGQGLFDDLIADPDPWLVASGHLFRGHVHVNNGMVSEGEAEARIALDGYRSVGDRWGIANSLAALAEVSTMRGKNDEAISVMREAVAFVDEIGATEETPYMRSSLAIAHNATGDRVAAEAALDEALRICLGGDDRAGQAQVYRIRGDFAREDGDLDLARDHYTESVRLLDAHGSSPPQFRAALHSSLGLLAEEEGDRARSRRLHRDALALAVDSQDGPILGHALIAMAGLALLEGEAERSAALLGGAAAMRGIDEVAGFDHVRITGNARAALGPEEFSRCHERGRFMPRDEMLALAGDYLS